MRCLGFPVAEVVPRFFRGEDLGGAVFFGGFIACSTAVKLGAMTDSKHAPSAQPFRAVLSAHRSLSRTAFLILMSALCLVSFIAGAIFFAMGAWPVTGFFGLDVLLIYVAFKLNYRSGRAFEVVEVTPDLLTITRVDPAGRREAFEFNPYWVRVLVPEMPDGRTDLRLALHGKEFSFGRYLTDDERKEFAGVLREALAAARLATP
jgi:uncharacterized membrane protein